MKLLLLSFVTFISIALFADDKTDKASAEKTFTSTGDAKAQPASKPSNGKAEFDAMKKAAEEGDPKAQYDLAKYYANGPFQDYKKAVE